MNTRKENTWTPAEKRFLAANYGFMPTDDIATYLSARHSRSSIYSKAAEMGLTNGRRKPDVRTRLQKIIKHRNNEAK